MDPNMFMALLGGGGGGDPDDPSMMTRGGDNTMDVLQHLLMAKKIKGSVAQIEKEVCLLGVDGRMLSKISAIAKFLGCIDFSEKAGGKTVRGTTVTGKSDSAVGKLKKEAADEQSKEQEITSTMQVPVITQEEKASSGPKKSRRGKAEKTKSSKVKVRVPRIGIYGTPIVIKKTQESDVNGQFAENAEDVEENSTKRAKRDDGRPAAEQTKEEAEAPTTLKTIDKFWSNAEFATGLLHSTLSGPGRAFRRSMKIDRDLSGFAIDIGSSGGVVPLVLSAVFPNLVFYPTERDFEGQELGLSLLKECYHALMTERHEYFANNLEQCGYPSTDKTMVTKEDEDFKKARDPKKAKDAKKKAEGAKKAKDKDAKKATKAFGSDPLFVDDFGFNYIEDESDLSTKRDHRTRSMCDMMGRSYETMPEIYDTIVGNSAIKRHALRSLLSRSVCVDVMDNAIVDSKMGRFVEEENLQNYKYVQQSRAEMTGKKASGKWSPKKTAADLAKDVDKIGKSLKPLIENQTGTFESEVSFNVVKEDVLRGRWPNVEHLAGRVTLLLWGSILTQVGQRNPQVWKCALLGASRLLREGGIVAMYDCDKYGKFGNAEHAKQFIHSEKLPLEILAREEVVDLSGDPDGRYFMWVFRKVENIDEQKAVLPSGEAQSSSSGLLSSTKVESKQSPSIFSSSSGTSLFNKPPTPPSKSYYLKPSQEQLVSRSQLFSSIADDFFDGKRYSDFFYKFRRTGVSNREQQLWEAVSYYIQASDALMLSVWSDLQIAKFTRVMQFGLTGRLREIHKAITGTDSQDVSKAFMKLLKMLKWETRLQSTSPESSFAENFLLSALSRLYRQLGRCYSELSTMFLGEKCVNYIAQCIADGNRTIGKVANMDDASIKSIQRRRKKLLLGGEILAEAVLFDFVAQQLLVEEEKNPDAEGKDGVCVAKAVDETEECDEKGMEGDKVQYDEHTHESENSSKKPTTPIGDTTPIGHMFEGVKGLLNIAYSRDLVKDTDQEVSDAESDVSDIHEEQDPCPSPKKEFDVAKLHSSLRKRHYGLSWNRRRSVFCWFRMAARGWKPKRRFCWSPNYSLKQKMRHEYYVRRMHATKAKRFEIWSRFAAERLELPPAEYSRMMQMMGGMPGMGGMSGLDPGRMQDGDPCAQQ